MKRSLLARLRRNFLTGLIVLLPATPNPTSGFLLFVPEKKVARLEMSVADGIKYIISLGAIVPGIEKRK